MLEVPVLKVRDDDAPPVLAPEVVKRMTKATQQGNKRNRSLWLAARNEVLLSLLADTGLRAFECAGLLLENLDLPARQAYVHAEIAKGRNPRNIVFGFKTAKLLARYLREREAQAFAFLPVPTTMSPLPPSWWWCQWLWWSMCSLLSWVGVRTRRAC
jgi:integrase